VVNVTALIPVKGFRNAKQRLSAVLNGMQREALAEAMFRDVLRAVVAARGLAATSVVTGDEQVAAIAASFNVAVIREHAESGETDAVNFARATLQQSGCEAVLILPGDMPLVRNKDIETLLALLPSDACQPFTLLVPSHDRMGTNALLLAPPEIIKLRFGYDSFNFHMSEVAALGLPLRSTENERIALDIDEPQDLERFLAFDDRTLESTRVARAMLSEPLAANYRRFEGL
jgi:2-phospho-L-lactate guanylyltransferase